MQSTLDPKPTDDPHDFLVVPPDAVRVVPTDEELSNLLREAARHHSDPQKQAGSPLPAGPPAPAVDATFRATDVNDVVIAGERESIGGRVLRGFAALLLALCIGVAGIAWQTYGDAATQMLAAWAPQSALTSSLPAEKPDPSVQPAPTAVEAAAANTAPPQPAPPQPAPPAQAAAAESAAPAAPSSDSSQLIQSMARDLASAGQEIEQLKAAIEQLKAGQQQLSRDLAKASEVRASEVKASEVRPSEVRASEQSARPRSAAPPPRPAAARVRRPTSIPSAQTAAAPILPQSPAPYYAPYAPRQIDPPPQATVQPEADPELSSPPRPPMPVR
jgi:flagellar motor protein MotB